MIYFLYRFFYLWSRKEFFYEKKKKERFDLLFFLSFKKCWLYCSQWNFIGNFMCNLKSMIFLSLLSSSLLWSGTEFFLHKKKKKKKKIISKECWLYCSHEIWLMMWCVIEKVWFFSLCCHLILYDLGSSFLTRTKERFIFSLFLFILFLSNIDMFSWNFSWNFIDFLYNLKNMTYFLHNFFSLMIWD